MASNDWHRMNNIVCEIERNRIKIENACVHCLYNRHSLVKNLIPELQSKQDALYDRLHDHTREMLDKLDKEGK